MKFQILSFLLCFSLRLGATALPVDVSQPPKVHNEVPAGLAKSEWADIRQAYEAGRHAARAVDGGHLARNPGQQWVTKFDSSGFTTTPDSGGWQWGLELRSYGFSGNEQTAFSKTPVVTADGQRITVARDSRLQEWFINDQRGLEHGFTLQNRPSSDIALDPQDSRLNFTLNVRGSLRPTVAGDAQGVLFQNDQGATVLTYNGLKVWDADGKILPSHFTPSEAGIRLSVDERGARYPITVDPIAQQAYLKASNTDGRDGFGFSVAMAGDTVVIGAPDEYGSGIGVNPASNESAPGAGAAYVFVRSGGSWSQQAYLKASNSGSGDGFGCSVAIHGDTVVVGASEEDGSGNQVDPPSDNLALRAGAAYVFVRSGVTWTHQAYLKASASEADDYFGTSVGIADDTVIVGAPKEDGSGTGVDPPFNNGANQAGAAYLFVRNGATWSSQAYLKASNTQVADEFGTSVAISGGTVIVGAMWEDGGGNGVDPPSDELAVGAGAAYVFILNGVTWSQQAYLKASNSGGFDNFGASVAVSGNTVVVGADYEDGSGTGINPVPNDLKTNSGAAYIFFRSGAKWGHQAYLKASSTGVDDQFGSAVTIAGDTVAVGADHDSGGTAYVFNRSGATWEQQAYLKASNTNSGDFFGKSVAVSGDTLVVGADGEDSSGIGVNPVSDELAGDAGAAYIFTGLGPPEMQIEQNSVVITNGGNKTFGNVAAGSTTDLIFTIFNKGFADLSLSGVPVVSVSGPDAAMFTVSTQPVSPISAPSGSTTFTVSFTPTSGGTKTASISIPNNDGDENPYVINLFGSVPPAEIAVEQAGANITDGGIKSLAAAVVGTTSDTTFTIKNTGGLPLFLNGTPKVQLTGSDAALFTVTTPPTSPVGGLSSTTFILRFAPVSGGLKAAFLTIPNNDADEGPFNIALSARALTFTNDTDGDGLNDASEFQLAGLGFDWQSAQPALVTTYYASAGGAGLFTTSQVQSLNVATPLIQKNPATGIFTLTLGVEKSLDLINFTPFPMTAPQTSINAQGNLEFQFTVPDNAAFFRVLAR